jgi:hypothetical protein
MNEDIVERLRSAVSSRIFPTADEYAAVLSIEAWDAAAEIERLRARVAVLEAALRDIVGDERYDRWMRGESNP